MVSNYELITVGEQATPIVVIDGFIPDPLSLVETIAQHHPFTKQDGDFYQVNNVKNKNIYSLRDDKFLAEQEVDFVNEYESFNLDHKVYDRKAYLYGVKVVLDLYHDLEGFNLGLENLIAKKINI